MKEIITTILTGSIAFMLAVAPAFAASTDDPGIQKREANQERRIDQGVKSGQLTPQEAGKLEAREAKIKQDEERMKSDGKLTKKERAKLTKEQNRASKKIYKKKHNEKKVDVGEVK
jgi:hypothetical protein